MESIKEGVEYLTRDGRRVLTGKTFPQSAKGGTTYGVYFQYVESGHGGSCWGNGQYAGRYSTVGESEKDLVSLFTPEFISPQQLDLFDL